MRSGWCGRRILSEGVTEYMCVQHMANVSDGESLVFITYKGSNPLLPTKDLWRNGIRQPSLRRVYTLMGELEVQILSSPLLKNIKKGE